MGHGNPFPWQLHNVQNVGVVYKPMGDIMMAVFPRITPPAPHPLFSLCMFIVFVLPLFFARLFGFLLSVYVFHLSLSSRLSHGMVSSFHCRFYFSTWLL